MNTTSKIPNNLAVQNMYSFALNLGKCYASIAAQAAIED